MGNKDWVALCRDFEQVCLVLLVPCSCHTALDLSDNCYVTVICFDGVFLLDSCSSFPSAPGALGLLTS